MIRWPRFAFILAFAIAPSVHAQDVRMSVDTQTEANRETVRKAFAAWADGEAIFDDLLADDVIWTIHGSDPVAGTYNGRADFIDRASRPLTRRLAGPITPEVHDIWADEATVIVRFDGSATTVTGATYQNQFVWIFQMADGLVVRAEAFLDLAAYRAVVENTPLTGD